MSDTDIQEELVQYLEEGNAHVPLEEAISGVSQASRCREVDDLPYTLWDLLEHIRIAQWDIVSFCQGPGHESPPFPDGYWPEDRASVSDKTWRSSMEQVRSDTQTMIDLIGDSNRSLTEPFDWGTGQTLLHEAQLLIDHRSYHTGQIIVLRRLMGNWSSDSPGVSI